MTPDIALYIGAFIAFMLAAFKPKMSVTSIDTWPLGWALLVLTLLV